MSSAGSLSYSSYAAIASTVTLENIKSIAPTDDGVTVGIKLNLDAHAQPQKDVVTIDATLPGADAYYRVTIDDYTTHAPQTFTYLYKTGSGGTAQAIAAHLAALINAATPNHPEVAATVQSAPNDNKIDVTSLLAGTNGAFTLTVECISAASNSAASGSPISSASTPGSGTGKVRSIVEFTVELLASDASAQAAAYPELRLTGTWFNGAEPAVQQSTISLAKFSGPLSLDALRSVS